MFNFLKRMIVRAFLFMKFISWRDFFCKRKSARSARSYKMGIVGNNWLVGNASFSETALRIFLIFCIKLGEYKGRKVTELYF